MQSSGPKRPQSHWSRTSLQMSMSLTRLEKVDPMDRQISFHRAINEALAQEMERDTTIILMGEDIAGGSGTEGTMDAWGGPLGITKGLWSKFGDRVMDTPITESAFVGAAIGAAVSGLRPVVELMFVDFMGVCFDQI